MGCGSVGEVDMVFGVEFDSGGVVRDCFFEILG